MCLAALPPHLPCQDALQTQQNFTKHCPLVAQAVQRGLRHLAQRVRTCVQARSLLELAGGAWPGSPMQ